MTRTTESLDDGRVIFREAQETTQALDPVCGMEVDPRSATEKTEHGGTTYSFCSRSCRERFEENPEEFIAAT